MSTPRRPWMPGMTDLRKAAEAALEALDAICDDLIEGDSFGAEQIARRGGASVRTMLRAALAAKPEPVAWLEGPFGELRRNLAWRLDPMPPQSVAWSIPLYTAPPAREPVADAARVIEWATSTPRKAAVHAFTDGPERQAAYWIEWAERRVVNPGLTTETAREPVAILHRHPAVGVLRVEYTDEVTELPDGAHPLYTAPPAREPVRLDDAARYQWLRDSSHWPAVFAASDAPEPLRGSELDAAIDAVLRAQESDR